MNNVVEIDPDPGNPLDIPNRGTKSDLHLRSQYLNEVETSLDKEVFTKIILTVSETAECLTFSFSKVLRCTKIIFIVL